MKEMPGINMTDFPAPGIVTSDSSKFNRLLRGEIKAKNGEEALRRCIEAENQGKFIKAVLLDLTIPGGLGGKDVVAELRKKYPDIPVFASSGYTEDPVITRPAEFGFTDSISKPFRKSQLIDMLNKYLKEEK